MRTFRPIPEIDDSARARFFTKVGLPNERGCTEWMAARTRGERGGYGQFTIRGHRGQAFTASRVAWAITYGPPPTDMHICHTCDNPPCVNPSHLFLGSQQDNSADMVRKGRAPVGEQRASNKIKESDVARLLILRATGSTVADLSKAFGISTQVVWAITCGRKWRAATGLAHGEYFGRLG